MCARFTQLLTWAELVELLRMPGAPRDLRSNWNVAPTQLVFAIRGAGEDRTIDALRWGLIPSWAKDAKIGNSLINARGETAVAKPAFRAAFKTRRCVIPASGFYEWTGPAKARQPVYITQASGRPMLFAGLWECWWPKDQTDADPVETCTILTTARNECIAPIHDRMPVILEPAAAERWLDPHVPPAAAAELLQPCPAEALTMRRVSPIVNKPANNNPDCIAAFSDPPAEGAAG